MAHSLSSALDFPGRAAGKRRRDGVFEARPYLMSIGIRLEALASAEHGAAFRRLVHEEQDRQQVHVGEREGVANQMAGLGYGAVEHREVLLHLGQRSVDGRTVGAAVGGPR